MDTEITKKFFIGINCFPGNDKYKFKRLLASLLVKPKFNEKWYPETSLSQQTFESPLMTYFKNEAEFIRRNLMSVCNASLTKMVNSLLEKRFERSTSDACVEFLVDGLELPNKDLMDIIEEFKQFHKNVIVSGTKYHTSVTVNRNIFLKNHKSDYVCFCDDDDISCSIDVKVELFRIYLNYIYYQIKDTNLRTIPEFKKYVGSENVIECITNIVSSDKTKLSDFDIMNLTDKFRKATFDFLLTNPDYKPTVVNKNVNKVVEQSDIKQSDVNKDIKQLDAEQSDVDKNINQSDYKISDVKQSDVNNDVKQTDNKTSDVNKDFHGPSIKEPIKLTDYLILKPYSYATIASKLIYYTISYFGPHFFQTYTIKHNKNSICYGIWSLIIPPWTIDNYTNVKEVKNEDVIYDVMHHLIRPNSWLMIKNTRPTYFYMMPSFNDYSALTTNDAIASVSNTIMFGPSRKYKLSKKGFEYDSIVEYKRNGQSSFEFVADRDFRGYSVEDVQKYIFETHGCKDNNFIKIWDNIIREYDL